MFGPWRENERLLAENALLRDECSRLRTEVRHARDLHLKEIAANRRRENALNEKIRELSGAGRFSLPVHADNMPEAPSAPADGLRDEQPGLFFEQAVTNVVDQLAEQAAQRNEPFDALEMQRLREAVSQHPETYGIYEN